MLLYYKCSNCRVLTQLIYVISKVINNDNDLAKKNSSHLSADVAGEVSALLVDEAVAPEGGGVGE